MLEDMMRTIIYFILIKQNCVKEWNSRAFSISLYFMFNIDIFSITFNYWKLFTIDNSNVIREKSCYEKHLCLSLFFQKEKENRNLSFENLFYIDKSKVLNEKENRLIGKEKKSWNPLDSTQKYHKEKFQKIRRVELTETVSSITPPPFLNIIRVPRWKDKKIK